MKTIVVNLLGGSGLGKSTAAADIFARLKYRKQHCELVREYVKELAWAGMGVGPFGQSIIYGRQLERESALYQKVDFIVTDSPLILCPIYQLHHTGKDSIKHTVFNDLQTASDMEVLHMNFLLKRNKEFDPRGRYETEDQAKVIDKKVEAFMICHNINYIPVDQADNDKVQFIVETVLSTKQKTES